MARGDNKVLLSRTALKTLVTVAEKELIKLKSEHAAPERIIVVGKAIKYGRSALNG